MSSFNAIYLEQANLLLEVLAYMDWNDCFALKGGTAINFFFSPRLSRMSVDIDLAYLPLNSRHVAFDEMSKSLKDYQIKFKTVYIR